MPPSSGNGPPGGRGGKEVDAVNISISNQNGKPIYEQITEQIKALILSGQLGRRWLSDRHSPADILAITPPELAYTSAEAQLSFW